MSFEDEEKTENTKLRIEKILRLIPKKKTLYVEIETTDKEKQNINNTNKIDQVPIFYTLTPIDPNNIKENEIFNFPNQINSFQNFEEIIKTGLYNQIILIDRGYLFKKENPKKPIINLIVDRNEKNDIYIYQLKPTINLEKNSKTNFIFCCEDKNCNAEGILDIEKNTFSIIKKHKIQHKDYHINNTHYTIQIFWNFLYKFKEIKTVQVLIVPLEYDIKTLSSQNIDFSPNTFNVTSNSIINEENTPPKKKEVIFNVKMDNSLNKSLSVIREENEEDEIAENNHLLNKTIDENNIVTLNITNINNSNNKNIFISERDHNCHYKFNCKVIDKTKEIKDENNNSLIQDSIDKEFSKNINNQFNISTINKEKENIIKHEKNDKIENKKPDKNSTSKKKSKSKQKESKEKIKPISEEYIGEDFSLSGSEDLYQEIYIKSKKRRKITKTDYITLNNKIKEKNINKNDEDTESITYCSQCSICVKEKKNKSKKNIEKTNPLISINNNNINIDLLEKKHEPVYTELIVIGTPPPNGKYKKKDYKFFKSNRNPTLSFCEIEIDSRKEYHNYEKRKESWFKYFEYKYGKNQRLGMHFHRDEKDKNVIYGYQNRHLELGYSDKKLVYYCVNKNCNGNGKFDCERETFKQDKVHTCNKKLSTQQSEIVKFFKEHETYNDVQIVRIMKD